MAPFRVLASIAALLGALATPAAFAQPALSSAQRLTNLETTVAALALQVQAQGQQLSAQAATIANQASTIATLQAALTAEVANRKAYTDSAVATALASAKTYADGKVAPVADKLLHFSRSGNEVYITGANLHLRNGTGYTYNQVNGLGNLTIGYNDLRGSGADVRTGSHNLILGFGNNYSAAGAFVGGAHNNSNAHMASVYGGTGNTASGLYAHISGGYNNTASGNWSNIGGGQNKVASAQLANLP